MDGKEPITDPKDILDAFDTIRSIELMGFALEETAFKPKHFAGINKSMEILRNIHDDLVSRLPPDVVAQERAKSMPRPMDAPVPHPNGIPKEVV